MKKNKFKEKEKKVAYDIATPANEEKKKVLDFENEGTSFLVILLAIVAIISMLWLVNILKENKNNSDAETKEPSISYSEVIVGNMLNQKYDDYYVLAYNKNENKKDTIEYLISAKSLKYYIVNLDKAYNLSSVAETSNFKGSITEIKFKGTTLIHVKDAKIEKAYEGYEEIEKYLKSIKTDSDKK